MRKVWITVFMFLFILGVSPDAKSQVNPVQDSVATDSVPKGIRSAVKTGGNTNPEGAVKTNASETLSKNEIKILEDSLKQELSVFKDQPAPKTQKIFDPDKAWKRSAVFPGWGQFYNKAYWKPPIIYAGFGTLGYLWFWNNENYLNTRADYICSLDGSCNTFSSVDSQTLKNERDFYRRNRDLTAIVGVIWYLLNVVDSYVEAHLKGFNVTDDIALRVKPSLDYNPAHRQMSVGASISLGFK